MLFRYNYLRVANAGGDVRQFASEADAKAAPQIADEQKYATEIDNLNKDIAGLKDKCSQLEVRFASWLVFFLNFF